MLASLVHILDESHPPFTVAQATHKVVVPTQSGEGTLPLLALKLMMASTAKPLDGVGLMVDGVRPGRRIVRVALAEAGANTDAATAVLVEVAAVVAVRHVILGPAQAGQQAERVGDVPRALAKHREVGELRFHVAGGGNDVVGITGNVIGCNVCINLGL